MSQMSLKLGQKERLEYIEKNILFETLDVIAEHCNVTPRTIDRDIAKWKTNGGFNRFLVKEFFQLYAVEKRQNPSRALDRILYLMGKQLTPEASTTINIHNQINELIQISREEQGCSNSQESQP